MKHHVILFLSVFWQSFGYFLTIYKKNALTLSAVSLRKNGEYDQALFMENHVTRTRTSSSREHQAWNL